MNAVPRAGLPASVLDVNTRLAVLLTVQLCLVMRSVAAGSASSASSASLALLPEVRAKLPTGFPELEALRVGMHMLMRAYTALEWAMAQEEARKACMPFLRAMTSECIVATTADALRAG
jgi:hypothetical protein